MYLLELDIPYLNKQDFFNPYPEFELYRLLKLISD
ncbi:hypothetical protein [Francisella persica]